MAKKEEEEGERGDGIRSPEVSVRSLLSRGKWEGKKKKTTFSWEIPERRRGNFQQRETAKSVNDLCALLWEIQFFDRCALSVHIRTISEFFADGVGMDLKGLLLLLRLLHLAAEIGCIITRGPCGP